jgi:hypothetical protein
MISGKLVHLIVSHWDNITDRVWEHANRDPEMAHTRLALGTCFRQSHRELLESLNHWLATGDVQTVARHYRHIGRQRLEKDVPLYACIKDLCVLKEELLDFVEENTFNKDSMMLYAEEELDRRVGRFFDLVMVNMIQGYEEAAMKLLPMPV